MIPSDIVTDILSRLSARSIARCRCVSKLWASMLRSPDFTEVYLTRSLTRPRFIFACLKDDRWFIYSSAQPDESSGIVAANYHMSFPAHGSYRPPTHVHGLMCHLRSTKGREKTMLEIYNPSTGQSLPLPDRKLPLPLDRVKFYSFFGYDPIEKQYKILYMTSKHCPIKKQYKGLYVTNSKEEDIMKEHHILTVGSGRLLWRTIESDMPQYSSPTGGVCINGVLYFKAVVSSTTRIVCFDFRSEKFGFIKSMETYSSPMDSGALVNYDGKLGLFACGWFSCIRRLSTDFDLWVLEDSETHVWSKHTYPLPALWVNNVVEYRSFYFVGVSRTKELVFSDDRSAVELFYYNTERNTMLGVKIQEMEAFKGHIVYTYLDHIEDVKLFDQKKRKRDCEASTKI